MQSQIIIDRFLRSEHSHEYHMHSHEKLILFFLASYMGKKSTCYPSIKSLAIDCNLSIDSIRRGLRSLAEKGLINILRVSGYNNRYSFNLSMIDKANATQCPQPLVADSYPPDMLTATPPGADSTLNNINNPIKKYTSVNTSEVEILPIDLPETNPSADIEVFKYWQEVMSHPKAKFDKHRQAIINRALQEGFTVDELKLAIDGCANTPFNMGKNDRRQIYDDINLIFRDADRIERFIKNATNNSNIQSLNASDLMAGVI